MFGFESASSKLSGNVAREVREKMMRVKTNRLNESDREQMARNIAGKKRYNVIWKDVIWK